jgi:hypothetical protein
MGIPYASLPSRISASITTSSKLPKYSRLRIYFTLAKKFGRCKQNFAVGSSLGLDEKWAYNVFKKVGDSGEIFARNVGAKSKINLPRGLNNLWSAGGLIYAPPLR